MYVVQKWNSEQLFLCKGTIQPAVFDVIVFDSGSEFFGLFKNYHTLTDIFYSKDLVLKILFIK